MASDQTKRKLAAVLIADVAGYSRLMGADDEGTLARLKLLRRELIEPKNKQHRGRIVRTTGDAILIEFLSVVDAVRCAIEIQQCMVERNADVPQEKRIELRVGVNLGDVMIEGRDLYGDGVNIAARLEALAPGLVDHTEVKAHLAHLQAVCEGGAAAGPLAELSQLERFHWLVAPRSTIIQTSPVHGGLCDDPGAALADLMERFVAG